MLTKLLAVAVGGAAGSCARWLLGGAVQRWAGDHFPVGTLAVNTVGCVAIGLVAAWMMGGHGGAADAPGRFALPTAEARHLLLMAGVLGGFTTFSTFALDALALVETGQKGRALAYIALSNLLCLGGVAAGWWGGQRVLAA